jgi:lambda repressor-like predicted transcriptional regulator
MADDKKRGPDRGKAKPHPKKTTPKPSEAIPDHYAALIQPKDLARCYMGATALATGMTMEKAAKCAGVARSTLDSWTRQPWWPEVVNKAASVYPQFKLLLDTALKRMVDEMNNPLSMDGAMMAAKVLDYMMMVNGGGTASGTAAQGATITLNVIGQHNAREIVRAAAPLVGADEPG